MAGPSAKVIRAARQRRKRIADAVASEGLTIPEAVERFRVSERTVRDALEEHAVEPRHAGRGPTSDMTFRILAALINTADGQKPIADELGVSAQRVNQVASKTPAAGIKLHPKRKLYRS